MLYKDTEWRATVVYNGNTINLETIGKRPDYLRRRSYEMDLPEGRAHYADIKTDFELNNSRQSPESKN